ncbi:hypothetical protein [Thalassococcus sp. S3]|uniref:hypothetical protein n=1 Tax=Thalassococcus sp. S3 TaxID=2017482 RepID=UPI0010242FFA|nr:hypothetical protein [Thalassococcus sp. S3]QBF29983.1 hypothetical protein CFI11_01935 [Thalassococcus sp. S3]
MRWFLSVCLCLLCACNAPTRHFRDVPLTRIAVEDSIFDIRIKGELAEAVRINRQYAPRLGPIGPRAARAMAHISGCEVERILGDQAVILGILDCDGVPNTYPRTSGQYDCITVDRWTNHGLGIETLEFECSPY